MCHVDCTWRSVAAFIIQNALLIATVGFSVASLSISSIAVFFFLGLSLSVPSLHRSFSPSISFFSTIWSSPLRLSRVVILKLGFCPQIRLVGRLFHFLCLGVWVILHWRVEKSRYCHIKSFRSPILNVWWSNCFTCIIALPTAQIMNRESLCLYESGLVKLAVLVFKSL